MNKNQIILAHVFFINFRLLILEAEARDMFISMCKSSESGILTRTIQIPPSNLKRNSDGEHFVMNKTFLHYHTDKLPRKIEKLGKMRHQQRSLLWICP